MVSDDIYDYHNCTNDNDVMLTVESDYSVMIFVVVIGIFVQFCS